MQPGTLTTRPQRWSTGIKGECKTREEWCHEHSGCGSGRGEEYKLESVCDPCDETLACSEVAHWSALLSNARFS
jgi:hypothetical protein